MKKINKLMYLVFSVTIFFTSCEKLLDEDPKYASDARTVFSTKTGAETVLNNSYGHLANVYGFYLPIATASNGTSWGIGTRLSSGYQKSASFDSYPEEGNFLGNTWKGFNKVVAESNYLIDGIDKSSLSEDYKKYARAHAHFLRGMAYYKLANLFGKAIVNTKPITTENLQLPLNSREEVYNQAIKDLNYAVENLNIEEGEVIVGRATKQSAQAFLAKCYWLMGCRAQSEGKDATDLFKKAKMYGDDVIQSGKYSLESNYANLFKSHVGKSPESIFQLNFSNANGPQNRSNFYYGPQASYATSGAKSWGNICMDRAFYDYHKGTYEDDPRIESTYMTKYMTTNGSYRYTYPNVRYTENKKEVIYDLNTAPISNGNRKNPEYEFDKMPSVVSQLMKKAGRWSPDKDWFWPYNAKKADPNSSAVGFDSKNLIIFRYADLLLLMADIENELGNKSKALEYANKVLERARKSGGANATYPMDINSSISKEELRDKIFFERMFEMAGEVELYEDVRRRGTDYLRKIIEIHNNSHTTKYIVSVQGTNPWVEYLINNGNSSDENFLKKNLVLPIPSDEINYNEKITQEDQNFGY